MEGSIRLENRTLSIEFLGDRHSQDRLEQAYRRIEMLAIAPSHLSDSVQSVELDSLVTTSFATEYEG